MDAIQSHVFGERPRDALVVVVIVALVSATVLGALGLLGISVEGTLGELLFIIVFSGLPLLSGVACGVFRLGFPAATVAGISPGVAFYVVATAGAALQLAGFGGGDAPAWAIAFAFAAVGFVWAVFGFAAGVAVAVYRG